MRIRQHHALCAQFFVGKGYSEQFVEHMYRVLAKLACDGAIVTLTDKCDDICTACPNNRNGVCESDAKVAAIDRRAAKAMGVKPGDALPWQDLCLLAKSNIIEPGKLREICADCKWIGICSQSAGSWGEGNE